MDEITAVYKFLCLCIVIYVSAVEFELCSVSRFDLILEHWLCTYDCVSVCATVWAWTFHRTKWPPSDWWVNHANAPHADPQTSAGKTPTLREREIEKGIAGECIVFYLLLLKAPLKALQMGTIKQNILTKSRAVAYTISIHYPELNTFFLLWLVQTKHTLLLKSIELIGFCFLSIFKYINIASKIDFWTLV